MSKERKVINRFVKDALAGGYTLSVFDSEEWTVKHSTDEAEVMGALGTTDEEALRVRDAEGKCIGTAYLIYGNAPWEIIAYYGYSEETRETMEGLLKGSYELCKIYEGGAA